MFDNATQNNDNQQFSNSENCTSKEFVKSKAKDFLKEENIDTSSIITKEFERKKVNWQKTPSKNIKYKHEVNVFDVAAYILKKIGSMSTMKLQKLAYYAQAWSLVWDERPLFKEEIEAWANGPVIRDLFYFHRGQFLISSIPIGNPDLLNDKQRETIDAVLEFYGDKPAQWLIDLSHKEGPWQEARKGLPLNGSSNRIIRLDSMADYYSSLQEQDEDYEKTKN